MKNDFNHGLSQNDLMIIRDILKPYHDKITKISLFGSRAIGNYKPYSDIDMVLYGALLEEDMKHLNFLFTESMLAYSMDILHYEAIDYPPLKLHIDTYAKELFL